MKFLQILVLILVVIFFLTDADGQKTINDLVLVEGTVRLEKIFRSTKERKANKQIVSDAIVRFRDEKFKVYQTKTNEKGKYQINLPAGIYKIYSTESAERWMYAEFIKSNILITNKSKIKLNILLLPFGEG